MIIVMITVIIRMSVTVFRKRSSEKFEVVSQTEWRGLLCSVFGQNAVADVLSWGILNKNPNLEHRRSLTDLLPESHMELWRQSSFLAPCSFSASQSLKLPLSHPHILSHSIEISQKVGESCAGLGLVYVVCAELWYVIPNDKKPFALRSLI